MKDLQSKFQDSLFIQERTGKLGLGTAYIHGFKWALDRDYSGMPINDSTAGFKCYKREVLETINLDEIQFVGYAFQIEMKFKAWKYGFNVIEVPVIFTDRSEGESKMSGGIFYEAVLGVINMKIRSIFKNWKR